MGILLVDDHILFVEALRSLLEHHGIEVAGTARDGLEAVERVRALRPDLVLMDIQMPRCDGLEATRRIKAEFPDVKVVMLTMSDDDGDLFNAIRNGASGYITKDTHPDVFLGLLAAAARGEAAVTPQTATRIMREYAHSGGEPHQPPHPQARGGKGDREYGGLSPRQVEVLRLAAEGHTYREIAVKLSVSERTINYHMSEILDKLRLQNRAQAIAYATRHGLVGKSDVDNQSKRSKASPPGGGGEKTTGRGLHE